MLNLVAVPGMPRELLIEEILEAIVTLAKTEYARLEATVQSSLADAAGEESPAKRK